MTTASALLPTLEALLGPHGVLTGADARPYCTDWRGLCQGSAAAVLRPASTDQVAACVRLCAVNGAPIVPQGGNTGLAGGATPDHSATQFVLSLARLARIREIDPLDLTLIAEAGVVWQTAREAAAASGCLLPLSMASEGSAQLGGVLSTNAGGLHAHRYGSARELTLGLEVVLADGTVWNGLRRLRKDNAGYNLRSLFVGAEGTLGIITAACLRLVPAHVATETALCGVPSAAASLALLAALRHGAGDWLNACEYMSDAGIALVLAHMPGATLPIPRSPHYVLVELATSQHGAPLRESLETILAAAADGGDLAHATIANGLTQQVALWRLREDHTQAQARAGANLKHDIAVPVSRTAAFLDRATAACAPLMQGGTIAPFGHLGDGNIHFNLIDPNPARLAARAPALTEAILSIVRALDGTFSAEHGVGQLKTAQLADWRGGVELELMRAVKTAIDPDARFNPRKVFPARQGDRA